MTDEKDTIVADLVDKLIAELDTVKGSLMSLGVQLEQARARELNLIDAARLFAERCNAKPEEIAQLGIADVIPGRDGEPDRVAWNTLDDLVAASTFAMKQQATAAKFRMMKDQFVTYQLAVSKILDQLQAIGAKNRLSIHDVHDVLHLRDELQSLIRRKI